MKYAFFIVVAVVVFACKHEGNSGTDYSVYASKEFGFEVAYPATWDTTLKKPNTVFVAFEPDSDSFRENLNISVYDSEGKTLGEIAETNVEQATRFYGNVNIEKKQLKNKNGLDYVLLRMVMEKNGVNVVFLSGFFLNGNKLCTVSQSYDVTKQAVYDPGCRHVFDSFKWGK